MHLRFLGHLNSSVAQVPENSVNWFHHRVQVDLNGSVKMLYIYYLSRIIRNLFCFFFICENKGVTAQLISALFSPHK